MEGKESTEFALEFKWKNSVGDKMITALRKRLREPIFVPFVNELFRAIVRMTTGCRVFCSHRNC